MADREIVARERGQCMARLTRPEFGVLEDIFGTEWLFHCRGCVVQIELEDLRRML